MSDKEYLEALKKSQEVLDKIIEETFDELKARIDRALIATPFGFVLEMKCEVFKGHGKDEYESIRAYVLSVYHVWLIRTYPFIEKYGIVRIDTRQIGNEHYITISYTKGVMTR